MLDPNDLIEYFRKHIAFTKLLEMFDEKIRNKIADVKNLADLEKVVRENELFNMND